MSALKEFHQKENNILSFTVDMDFIHALLEKGEYEVARELLEKMIK